MKENSSVDELIRTIKDVISAYLEESTVSVAEMVGSLEILKQAYVQQAFEEEEDEED